MLAHVGYPIVTSTPGTLDEDLIPWMGNNDYVWLTKDDKARAEHEPLLVKANISTVWIRGLGRVGKGGRRPGKNAIRMKDILFLLVNRLETIEQEIRSARSSRHFILYMNDSTRKAVHLQYATLREVRDVLGGISSSRRSPRSR